MRIGFVRAVCTVDKTVTSPLCLKTQAAVPAHGKAWTGAVVTDRRIFIAEIIAIIPAIALITLLAQTHHLSTGFAGELGRIINTGGALGQQFVTIIRTMFSTITFEIRIQTNIKPTPFTLKQMVIGTVVALRRDVV